MRLSLAQVLGATGGRLTGGAPGEDFSSYHTDSREVAVGGLFFALRGAAMDGHAFAADAVARGAGGVVVERWVDVVVSGQTRVRTSQSARIIHPLMTGARP